MLRYIDNQLFFEEVPCLELAKIYGTPSYVYSASAIKDAFSLYQTKFAACHLLICYAVKANSNLSILRYLASLGSGFDIVSGGELFRVLTAGGDPQKTIFSGVNKSEAEISYALKANILCFNIESLPEIDRIQKVAKELDIIAPISFRINPDVDANTHPYISTGLKDNKFGIDFKYALQAFEYAAAQSHLQIKGIDCHIGSQLLDLSPLISAAEKIFELVTNLKSQGIILKHIDLGGGIGIPYHQEEPPILNEYANYLQNYFAKHPEHHLILEPGRSIIGNAGILLTKVDYIKQHYHKNFVIVDAGMNDLIRPALYGAYHEILPFNINNNITEFTADVVGPICETGDFLAKERTLNLQADDFIAVNSSGAYAASMASNYNSRPLAAEILVSGKHHHLIRKQQSYEQLVENELPFCDLS